MRHGATFEVVRPGHLDDRLALGGLEHVVAHRIAVPQDLDRLRDGVAHPQGLEEPLHDQALVAGGDAREHLDEPPGDRKPGVRVGKVLARRRQRRHLGHPADHTREALALAERVHQKPVAVEPPGVREQVADPHLRRPFVPGEPELVEVDMDRRVKVQPARVDILHRERGGERLRR